MTMPAITDIAVALRCVRARISRGWNKLTDDGSKTFFGWQPECDLYRAILGLGPMFPIDAVFDFVARRIVELYPDRVHCRLDSPYDARIMVIEFNDDPATSQANLLRVTCPIHRASARISAGIKYWRCGADD